MTMSLVTRKRAVTHPASDQSVLRALHIDLELAKCASAVLISASEELTLELARYIHRGGPRAACPFVVLTCRPATTAKEMASAFHKAKPDGTLFLRRVDELPKMSQAALHDYLTLSRARVIGGASTSIFDAVQEGHFDERLYYRLNQVHLIHLSS